MKVIKATQQMLETRTLVLGFQGENLRTQLRIDCSATFAEYPNATPALAIKPPAGETYPVFVERDGNEVVWDIVANNLAMKGDGELQLTFYKDNVIAKTSVGHITVNRSLQIDGEMPDVVATWIENANRKLAEVDAQITELEGMVDTATDAATRAEQSASTASTKAEQAAGSAATATAKATEATNAANTATAKASEAALSATQASNSAMSAANSESGATAKAAEAAQSAQTAAQKAEQITEAAQIATGKAEEASASATAAQASATNAASSATAASASETAAKASETAAGASATQAAQSAQNASTAAQTAEQKAGEAATSATNAAASATNAATSAETASTKAGEAAQSAQAVAETAEQLADSLEQIDQNTTDIAELDERKANIDGYYPDMTVGNAEQLNSSKYVENSEPYTLRTSGGSSDIGNREYLDSVVGGTLAWNQMLPNMHYTSDEKGLSFVNNNGSLTITGTIAEAFNYNYVTFTNLVNFHRDGRKYLLLLNHGIPYGWGIGGYGAIFDAGITSGIWTNNAGSDWNNGLVFRAEVGTTVDIHDLRACAFDLTQMFGSAVADYIYNLEQANAGAGVAYFRSWFPDDYYPYNAGELKHVEGLQSHDMAGFNQWDEEWEVGAYSSVDGTKATLQDRIRSKNFIPVFPSTNYYITTGLQVYYYDHEKNYIRWSSIGAAGVCTTPTDCYFMTFNGLANSGTTYKHDICINLAHNDSRNGEYEPYEKHSYPLDSTVVLRGIPKVGANGVYWDGDRYLPDGTVERRYGVVDLGTLEWTYNISSLGVFSTSSALTGLASRNLVCFKYPTKSGNTATSDITNTGGKWISANAGTGTTGSLPSGVLIIKDNDYTDAASFKAAMSGVYLVYELATPTTETAQPYHSTQWVSDWGTEEFVSTGLVPVGHETRYPANLRDKLQHLPDAASGNGSYLITQTDGQMVLTPFPAPPSTAGNYVLKATVTNGVATYTWEVAT